MFKDYLLTFIVAGGVSFMVTPLIRQISLKKGYLNKPNYRRINKKPVPTLGGIAIYMGLVISILVVIFRGNFRAEINKFLGFLIGISIIVFIGIIDDVIGLTARRKLLYQFIAAIIAVIFGYLIIKVTHPLGGFLTLSTLLGVGVTIFWIIGFTNALNLLDGLDGLAAGISTIIAGSLFFAAVRSNNPVVAILAIAIVGAAAGFLPYNFYPAKIFMGDTGSMLLGFSLALVAIEGTYKGSTFIVLFVPIIAMGVPVLDTLLSILRRLAKGEKVFSPDKEHIHHKLLLGNSQREVVLRLYFLTACFGLIAISLNNLGGIWAFAALVATGMLTLRWIVNSGFLDFIEEDSSSEK